MSTMLQSAIVAMIVACAMIYAAIRFMPAAWRRLVAARAAALVARWGMSEGYARRVEARLASGGACGSCETCKECATPGKTDEAAASTATPLRQIPIRTDSR